MGRRLQIVGLGAAVGVCLLLGLIGGVASTSAGAELEPLERTADRWLQAVAPWMTDGEETAFAGLRSARARELFAIDFWRLRGKLEGDDGRLWLEEWQRRIDEASARFGPRGGAADLRGDRARSLLVAGVPEQIVAFGGCRGQLRPARVWRYDRVQAAALSGAEVTDDLYLLFVRETPRAFDASDLFRQWSPDDGLRALYERDALTPARRGDDLIDFAAQHRCFRTGRREAEALRTAIEQAAPRDDLDGWVVRAADGWWRQPRSDVAEALLAVGGPVSIDYASAGRGHVVVRVRIELDVETLRGAPGGRVFDRLVLDGEVRAGTGARSLRLDRFRRVAVIAGVPPSSGRAVLEVERQLRPGSAMLDLRLVDARGLALLRQRLPLRVPDLDADADGTSDGAGSGRRAVSPQEALRLVTFPSVMLRPPGGAPVGVVELVAVTSGGPIARVDFELDGAVVGSDDRPPWRLAVDFGDVPERHAVAAVAYAPDGRRLARDRRELEAAVRPFAVRLAQDGGAVEATLSLPLDAMLEDVSFYRGDTLLRRLDKPPFRIVLPDGARSGWVRVVARCADGATAEDLLFLGRTPAQRLDVRLIEVLASVLDARGRPVADLRREEVRVLEDGVAMPLERFETVDDLPLRVALLLDSSVSMRDRLDAAVRSSRRFVGTVLRPDDSVALFDFDDDIRLRMPLTGDVDRLRLASGGLTARGGTRLWDAVVAAGTYLSGVRERRALIVLSDGRDVGSDYRAEQVGELLERSGVALYPILLDLRDPGTRTALGRLAERSGGAAFDVAAEGGLDAVFRRIEAELRAQFLLVYRAPPAERGDAYRRIDIDISRAGARVRAKRGYYP